MKEVSCKALLHMISAAAGGGKFTPSWMRANLANESTGAMTTVSRAETGTGPVHQAEMTASYPTEFERSLELCH